MELDIDDVFGMKFCAGVDNLLVFVHDGIPTLQCQLWIECHQPMMERVGIRLDKCKSMGNGGRHPSINFIEPLAELAAGGYRLR